MNEIWVIMRREDGSIQSINSYDTSIEEIKNRIKEFNKNPLTKQSPEIIEDKKIIEILNFINRFEDKKLMGDDQKRIEKLESAIEDIENILYRVRR